ncbi:hypothetical protein [Chengkuizengella axinellae]|uniref:Uncharacterized protein n=1 Tax=Chengkuizengella axinellae TaxID=3064388 RepID=A0ABT9IUL7_9BACL|nr:hypothetical protein [Chengkuizengella sp. 2205SS18-9]MDP5273056.1 hypothetical protein [Chengkuizengella sp. 2205SS18-9]
MRKKLCIFFIVILLFCTSPQISLSLEKNKIESINQVIVQIQSSESSDHISSLRIQSNDLLKRLEKSLSDKNRMNYSKVTYHELSDASLVIENNKNSKKYVISERFNLIDEDENIQIGLPNQIKRKLNIYVDMVRKKHYGELLTWNEVKEKMPKYTKFTVIDLETGLSFKVQRRAGNKHADVQPLTAEDSKIMKQIYNGHWSWNRRAVVIKNGHDSIAGSMNGMPHGGDGIPNNDFSGHFCIHFLGSTTHRQRNIDPSHQSMVYKAAGMWQQYIQNATPEDVIDSFFIALNQKDLFLLKTLFPHKNHEQIDTFKVEMEATTKIRKLSSESQETEKDDLWLAIPVQAVLTTKHNKNQIVVYTFHLQKNAITNVWKIYFVTKNF